MTSLVLFGDSLLARIQKRNEMFFLKELGGEYEIYNCATGGLDSNDLARKAPLIGTLRADVVLISVGTNDASPWKLVELDKFKQNLESICDALQGSRIIFFPPPPVVEERHVPNQQRLNSTMHTYNQAVVDLCKGRELEYWDSWVDLFPLVGDEQDPHGEDGVHFSDEGYGLVLKHLAKVVQS